MNQVTGGNLQGALAQLAHRVIRLRKEVAGFSFSQYSGKPEQNATQALFPPTIPTIGAQNVWLEREARVLVLEGERDQLQSQVASLREEVRLLTQQSAARKQESDWEIEACRLQLHEMEKKFQKQIKQHDQLKKSMDEMSNVVNCLTIEAEGCLGLLEKREFQVKEAQMEKLIVQREIMVLKEELDAKEEEIWNIEAMHAKHVENVVTVMNNECSQLLSEKCRMVDEVKREMENMRIELDRLQHESHHSNSLAKVTLYSTKGQIPEELDQNIQTSSLLKGPDIFLPDILPDLSDDDWERGSVNDIAEEKDNEVSSRATQKPLGFFTNLGAEVHFGSAYESDQQTASTKLAIISSELEDSHRACQEMIESKERCMCQAEIHDGSSTHSTSFRDSESTNYEDQLSLVGILEEMSAFGEYIEHVRNRDRRTVGIMSDLIECTEDLPNGKPDVAYAAEENNIDINNLSGEMYADWIQLRSRIHDLMDSSLDWRGLNLERYKSHEEEEEEEEEEEGRKHVVDDNLPCAYFPMASYTRPASVPSLDLSGVLLAGVETHIGERDVFCPNVSPLSCQSPLEDEEKQEAQAQGRACCPGPTTAKLLQDNEFLQHTVYELRQDVDRLHSNVDFANTQLDHVHEENLQLQNVVHEMEVLKVGDLDEIKCYTKAGVLQNEEMYRADVEKSELMSTAERLGLEVALQAERGDLKPPLNKGNSLYLDNRNELARSLDRMQEVNTHQMQAERGNQSDKIKVIDLPVSITGARLKEEEDYIQLELGSDTDKTIAFSFHSSCCSTRFRSESEEIGDLQFDHLQGDGFDQVGLDNHPEVDEGCVWVV